MKQFQLSRRAFLGGAGVMVSLPFLEAMIPRAQALGTATPQRLLVYFVPNGIHMPAWTPTTTGPGFELPPILQPLAAVKEQLLVVSGLGNAPGVPDGPGDHAAADVDASSGVDVQCQRARATDLRPLRQRPGERRGLAGGRRYYRGAGEEGSGG